MKLVCDTNVVFSALIAGGKTRELILSGRTGLYAPEFFFTELDSHRDEIEEKSRLSEDQLRLLRSILFKDTDVVPREEFEDHLEHSNRLIGETDPDDAPLPRARPLPRRGCLVRRHRLRGTRRGDSLEDPRTRESSRRRMTGTVTTPFCVLRAYLTHARLRV